jgi:molybdenum cofactor cytidylyltransferase
MDFDRIAVIVLASGKGERFGMPKAEARLGDLNFSEAAEHLLRMAGLDNIHIARGLDTPDMLSTLRETVKSIDLQQLSGILVFPVDHPFILPATIVSLCEEFISHPDSVVRPVFEGKAGHPVIIPVWLDLDADDRGQGLAGLIREQVCTVIDVPVNDPAVLKNVNHPEDMQ